jgi:hypothetical protein
MPSSDEEQRRCKLPILAKNQDIYGISISVLSNIENNVIWIK